MGDTGGDDLAPPGPARHEMRLDEPGGDPEIGADDAPVELHRRAPGRGKPQIDVGLRIPRKVVLDPGPCRATHGSPMSSASSSPRFGPVEPGRDEHRDLPGRDPGIDEDADHRPEKHPVGHRAGDVADEDARGPPAPGKARERRRPGGLGERPADGARGVADDRQRLLAQHRELRIPRGCAPEAALGRIRVPRSSLLHSCAAVWIGSWKGRRQASGRPGRRMHLGSGSLPIVSADRNLLKPICRRRSTGACVECMVLPPG